MKLKLRRFMAYMLVVMMLISVLPSSAFAEIAQAGSTAASQPSVSLLSIIKPDDSKYHTYIFYDINGKEIPGSRQILKHGETLRLPAVEAIDGKTFVNWTDENGAPLAIDAGAVTVEDNATIKCFAKYEEIYYIFFVNGKGDDARVIATEPCVSGQTVAMFNDIDLSKAFDESITGWYLDENLTQKVESVTITDSNVTVYAKVEKGFWITFESNGGTYVEHEFFVNGAFAEEPEKPAKAGYTFDGWYLNTALTLKADFSTLTSDTTVYAKWKPNSNTTYHVIHFWENADDNGYSFHEYETKTGTTDGKTSAAAKSYPGFTAQTITQEEIKGDGSTIVKVYYKRNVYEVKFYSNSGWFSSSEEYTGLRITAKYGANISDKWPTYNGSSAWATSDGGSTHQVNIDTMPLNGAEFYGPTTGQGSETAYYYVEVLPGETGTTSYGGRSYKLDHKDTSPGTGYSVTKEDQYPLTGFTFKGGTEIGKKYDNAKFYYTRNSYDIKFISGGTTVKTDSAKYQQSIADKDFKPENNLGGDKSDYIFDGWYDNELGEGEKFVFEGKTMPANNITLYAKWVPPTFTVTVYDVDGKTVLKTIKNVPKNSTINPDVMPEDQLSLEDDDKFLGWVNVKGKPFRFTTKITRDYELYPRLDNEHAFTVTYNGNGATGGSTVDSRKYDRHATADVKANGFTREGMLFLYWKTKDGMKVYPNDAIMIMNDVTLYAVWGEKRETVSLNYHSNFDTDTVFTVNELLNNDAITVKPYVDTKLPERTGYTFTGWNTKADGTGIAFAAGEAARLEGDGNHLYAQWKVNQYGYRVEYYIDGVKNDSMTETGKADFGTVIDSYTNKCPQGYVLDRTENLPLTIGTGENVIKVYYKKNVFTLTVKYVYAEGGPAAPDHIQEVPFGEGYSVDSPTIPGYVADKSNVSGTMPEKNVTATVTYSKRTDLSYTVYYYLNETEYAVADSKTVPNQTFNAEATEKPAVIEGYTPVRTADQSINIGVGENKIVFYYYKNVTLNANSATELYDGSAHSVEGFAISGELPTYEANFSAIKVDANGTNANTYPANFANGTVGKIDATKKYIVVAANNGTLTINPREVVLTSEDATKVYDGTALTRPNVTVSGDGFVKGEVTSVTATGSITNVGKIDNAIEYVKGEKFDAANYAIEVQEGKLEVTPVTAEVVVKIAGNTATFPYNGEAHSVTGYRVTDISNSLYTQNDFACKREFVAVLGVDANTYDMNLVKSDFENRSSNFTNVRFEVKDGWLKINPIEIKLTADSASKQYDGTPLTKNSYTMTGAFVNGEGLQSVTVVGSQLLVGESANTITEYALKENTKAQNYSITVWPGKLTVTDRAVKYVITVKAKSDEKTYNGKPLTVSGLKDTEFTVNGQKYTVEGLSASKEGTNVIDSGAVVIGGTEIVRDKAGNDVTKQFTVKRVDGTLTINPRKVVLTSESAKKQYDGTPLTRPDVTVDGTFVEGEVSDVTAIGTITEIGSVVNTIVFTAGAAFDGRNYTIVSHEGKLEITASEKELKVVANSNSWTYDGQEHADGGYTVTYGEESYTVKAGESAKLSTGDTVTAKITKTVKNVSDTATGNNEIVELKITNHAQYTNVKQESGTLSITPIEIELTAGSDEKVYNGTELTKNTYSVTKGAFVSGEGVATATVVGSQLNVGESDNVIEEYVLTAATLPENYSITLKPGKLIVTPVTDKVTVTINENSGKFTYDAQAHTVTGYSSMVSNNNLYEVQTSVKVTGDQAHWAATATDAGTYPLGILSTDFENVNPNFTNVEFEIVDGTMVIDPMKVTITAGSARRKYNGTPLTQPEFTATALATGDSHVFTVLMTGESTLTNFGKTANVIATVDGVNVETGVETKVGSYLVTTGDGELEIQKRTVIMTSGSGKKVYDGKPLTNSTVNVTGDGFATGEGATYDVTGSQLSVGKSDNEFTYALNKNTLAENYTIETKFGELEVTQLTDKVVVTIVGNTKTETYNGTEKTVTGYQVTSISNSLYKASDFEYKADKDVATETDAGKYMMGLAAEDFHNLNGNFENVTFEVTNGWLEILPAAITITAKDNTVEYDGKAHGEIGYDATATVKNQKIESVTIDGSKIDAGKYDDLLAPHDAKIVDADGNDVTKNYAITYDPGTLEITKRGAGEAKVKVIANDNTVTYDGEAHGENGYTTERLAKGHRVETVTIDGSKIDAGKYDDLLVPRDAKIVDADDNDVTKNYVITYVPNTLTINPVADKVTVTIVGNTKTETYDGSEKTAEGYQVTSISNPLYKASDFEFTGKASVSGTDADHYDMGLKASDFENVSKNFENVEFIVTDGGLTISPRKVKLTSGGGKKVYDGTPLTNSTVTVTGGFANGEGVTYDVTGSQLNVGKSDNTFTYTLNKGTKAKNYEIETKFGELEVTPVTDKVIVTIIGHEVTATYDGAAHTASGYDAASSNSLYTESCYEFGGSALVEGIHAGEYPMNLKAEDFKNISENFTNVEFVIEKEGGLTIEQRMLVITAGSYEGDYDAQWHEVGYTADGLADTDTITALEMKDNRILKPGTLTANFLPETLRITHENGSDSTGDYRVEYAPGTLTVNTVIVKYTVQYYYDGVLFGGLTEEGTGEVLTEITQYIDKPRDMMFDHVDNFPLTLGLNEEENVIRVYYVHIPLTGYLGAHNVGDCIE